eukprot:UN17386
MVQQAFDEGFNIVIRHCESYKVKRTPLSPRSARKTHSSRKTTSKSSKSRKKVLYKGGIERDDSHFICTVTLEEEIFEFVCLRVPSNETTHFRVR